MTVVINGTPTTVPPPCSVAALLDRLGLAGQACAVEVNRRLVPKRDHAAVALAEGDTIEVVTLVGGG